jgi:hypothetical protein
MCMCMVRHQMSRPILGMVVTALLCAGTLVAALDASSREQAGGKNPTVTVGGIQVAKVVAPKDEMMSRPFNSENGTKLVLWIQMPAGQGLIEIDEDTSVLQRFSDDKGTDLGGRFEGFPDEFKDGTGGTFEISSTGLPAAGAVRLMAEGILSLHVADGIKPIRVASFPLVNGRTVMLEKTTITVAEVETREGEVSFTLKLPRQVMEMIRDDEVRFFDAKGQAIEGSNTGSGYMNQAAEMRFTVKGAPKALTIEFDVWQGRRAIKIPFKVQAGMGLGG